MSTNSTAIRDAVFDRVSLLAPAGYPAWGLARKTTFPTLSVSMLPALQVIMADESMVPDGDADVGTPHFLGNCTISILVLRGVEDPAVIDGQADNDIDAILDCLLNDTTFISPLYQDRAGFNFRGVTRVHNQRHSFAQSAQSFMMVLELKLTFEYNISFSPIATVPLTGVTVGFPQMGGIRQTTEPSAYFYLPGKLQVASATLVASGGLVAQHT